MKIANDFLKLYLDYVEDTESPRLFHIWCALSGIAACAGRRIYYDFGIEEIYPNSYIILVGPPASRKNTAINIMTKMLREVTEVKFAPDDTGGKRQGLIAALDGSDIEEPGEFDAVADMLISGKEISQEALLLKLREQQIRVDSRDDNCLYAVATEFGSLMGQNSMEIITLLNKCFDGEAYEYRLKNTRMVLPKPLMSILAGTTPTSMAGILPPTSVDHGFTSRLVLVYDNRPYKDVAEPAPLDKQMAAQIKSVYSTIFYKMDGVLKPTHGARELFRQSYKVRTKLNDPRFIYYLDRRHIHVKKLASCLALSRLSMTIVEEDVQNALAILEETEVGMPEALGEFGLSPISLARQKMIEFLQYARGPVSQRVLWGVMGSDMKRADFMNSLEEMKAAAKITQITSEVHGITYVYNDPKTTEALDIWQSLTGEELQ
jgi:hypothetical protein